MGESIEFEQVLVELLVVNFYHFEHVQVVSLDEAQSISFHLIVEGCVISSHLEEPFVPVVIFLLVYTGLAQL